MGEEGGGRGGKGYKGGGWSIIKYKISRVERV